MKARTDTVVVGARVRIIPQHWLRGYQEAVIVEFKPGAQNNWLVKFDFGYPGGGIEGDKLWLDESYFYEVKPLDDELDNHVNGSASLVAEERGLQ